MRKVFPLFAAVAACFVGAFRAVVAAPMLPGYLTDPSANRKELAAGETETPASLKYPYISVYYVKPTLISGENAKIRWYATDFDHSLVRFGDTSRRFDVELKLTTDRKNFRRLTKTDMPSGDGEFDLGVRRPAAR